MSARPALMMCSSRSFSMGSMPLGTLSMSENIRCNSVIQGKGTSSVPGESSKHSGKWWSYVDQWQAMKWPTAGTIMLCVDTNNRLKYNIWDRTLSVTAAHSFLKVNRMSVHTNIQMSWSMRMGLQCSGKTVIVRYLRAVLGRDGVMILLASENVHVHVIVEICARESSQLMTSSEHLSAPVAQFLPYRLQHFPHTQAVFSKPAYSPTHFNWTESSFRFQELLWGCRTLITD